MHLHLPNLYLYHQLLKIYHFDLFVPLLLLVEFAKFYHLYNIVLLFQQ